METNTITIDELTGMYNLVLETTAKINVELADFTNVMDRVKSTAEAHGGDITDLKAKSVAFDKDFQAMHNSLGGISFKYSDLKKRVETNEESITDLYGKLKNATQNVNGTFEKIDKQMIGIDGSIANI